MKYYIVSSFINGVVFILLGLFVYFKNPKRLVNRVYFFFSLCVAEWAFSYVCWLVLGKDHTSGLFWARVLNSGPALLSVFYFHYILALFDWVRPKKKILIWSYIFGAIFFISSFTPFYVKDAIPKLQFPYYPTPGFMHPFFMVLFFGLPVYAYLLMSKFYPKASLVQKTQIRYLIVFSILGFIGGGSNFLLFYNIPFPPVFNIGTAIFPIVLAYLIVRYRLFEIDTVLHRTILWILTSCSILIPVGTLLFFTRSWLKALGWIQLTFFMTGLFYIFLFYYHKIQPRIDHMFRRRKYDYYKVLGEIGQKVGSELDISSVISRLFKELKDILYIRNGIVLVQQPGQIDFIEAGSIGYERSLEHENRAVASLSDQNALAGWMRRNIKAIEKEQVEIDPQYDAIRQDTLDFLRVNSIEVLIPVLMDNKVNALVGIGKKDNLQSYTGKDIELLESMGRQIGITIDNAIHHEDIVEKERLAEEMKLGREIQMALLPQEIPVIEGLDVWGIMQPAREIGGDYYDFIAMPGNDRLAVVIGDVSGKGVAAGLLMAMVKTAIHTLSQEQLSPKEILLRTNAILNTHIGGQKFMTLLYLAWEAKTRTVTYSSGGHEHILLYRDASGSVEAIQSGGFMLGMMPDIDKFLEEKRIRLDPGDKILLYTDGVTEAEERGGDRFGLERLKGAYRAHGKKPARELMEAIRDEVYSFIGAHPQYDDITLVVLEAR